MTDSTVFPYRTNSEHKKGERESTTENRLTDARGVKIARLRKELTALQGLDGKTVPNNQNTDTCFGNLSFGIPVINRHLAGGLTKGRIHEFGGPAALSLIVFLISRTDGDVLWCTPQSQHHNLYPPGLLPLGLDPRRLIHARTRTRDDLHWVAEEGLRSKAGLTVVIETATAMSLTVSRRLQLAAKMGASTALIITKDPNREANVICPAATTRWRINHLRSPKLNRMQSVNELELALIRNKSGTLGQWQVKWPFSGEIK